MAVTEWPSFIFPPKLRTIPKQNRDFMRNLAADRRAQNLKLVPTKRPGARSKIIIEPARGVGAAMQAEQILVNIYRRHGGK